MPPAKKPKPAAKKPSTPTLATLRRQATALEKKGDWGTDALRLNSKIAEKAPDDGKIALRIARCHAEAGDARGRIEWLRRALAAKKLPAADRAVVQAALDELESPPRDESPAAAARADEAQVIETPILELDARQQAAAEDALAQAEAELRRVREIRDLRHEPAAIAAVGQALRGLGRHGEALARARASLALDGSRTQNAAGWALLVAALAETGQVAEAIEAGELTVDANPRDPELLSAMTLAYGLAGDRARVESTLVAIARHGASHPALQQAATRALRGMATEHENRGDVARARRILAVIGTD